MGGIDKAEMLVGGHPILARVLRVLAPHCDPIALVGRTSVPEGLTYPFALIPDAVSIRERPAEVEDRALPGHWEGDLLMGGVSSRIATLVERRSRWVQLVRIGAKTSEDVVDALARQVQTLPDQLMRTLTWDRGSELTQHARFTMATNVQVYFCDPHSPWQRGSNENTNGLLRQYFPKGADLSDISQEQLDAVALELNTRPRKTLDFQTPADVFLRAVAVTG